MHKFGIWPAIEIKAPVEKVFSYLSDLTKHHEWNHEPKLVLQPDNAEPLRYKMTIVLKENIPGHGGWYGGYGGTSEVPKVHVVTVALAHAVPNRELVFQYEPWNLKRVLKLESRRGGTKVRYWSGKQDGFGANLATYFGKFNTKDRDALSRLKQQCELSATSSPDRLP